jgi:transposase
VVSGAFEPAKQCDQDLAWNPKLSPRYGGEHAGQIAYDFDVPRAGQKGEGLESVIQACAGMDVHKKSVEVCVRRIEPDGRLHLQTRSWGTTTGLLRQMAEWLAAQQVPHVARESTGVFWKPIYNILEGRFEVLLGNAQHLKQVPGRKTDGRDGPWIAQLMAERTRIVNWMHKLLEDATIQLAAVATDILGASGRDILRALIAGQEDAASLAELARGQLRGKIPELREALQGHLTEHHRYLLALLWEELSSRENFLARVGARIEELTRLLKRRASACAKSPASIGVLRKSCWPK